MNEQSLQALLKIKRLETPGQEYFNHFLPEFHRYQRAAILQQQPSWAERIQSILTSMTSQARYAYGFAAAVLLGVWVTLPQSFAPSTSGLVAAAQQDTREWTTTELATPVAYNDPMSQQTELHKTDPTRDTVTAPLYVTGDVVPTAYETSVTF